MEGQKMVIEGVLDGTPMAMEHIAGKDEKGYWLKLALYPQGTPEAEIQYVTVRPDEVAGLATSHSQLFRAIMKVGVHALIIDPELGDEEEGPGGFSDAFMPVFTDAAKVNGYEFFGPVGTVYVKAASTDETTGSLTRSDRITRDRYGRDYASVPSSGKSVAVQAASLLALLLLGLTLFALTQCAG